MCFLPGEAGANNKFAFDAGVVGTQHERQRYLHGAARVQVGPRGSTRL